jgi:CAAX protease family protein
MDEPRDQQKESSAKPEPQTAQVLPPAPQPPDFGDKMTLLFIGPDGLRAGWRFVAYVVLVVAVVIVLSLGTHFLLHSVAHKIPKIWGYLIGESTMLVAAIVPALVFSKFEKRPFGAYGLPRRGAFGRLFWVGALWGLAAITLLLVVMHLAGAFYFGGLALSGVRILKFAAFWGFFFLVVGFFEEFVARGYSQFTLTQGMGFWPAAILLSVLFGALHIGNQGEAWIGALSAGLIGFFFCFTLRRTGTLWFAVGMHAAWDWGESFLYSVPDSGEMSPGHLLNSSFHGPAWLTGGSVGPEGSVLVFVLIALLWIAFDRVFPDAKYGV